KRDWIPLVFASSMALLNLFIYGPRTQTAMIQRIHQGIANVANANAAQPHLSDAMRSKNRAFSRAHAMSIHLNLLSMIATVWYGVRLASRMNIEVEGKRVGRSSVFMVNER
ncbi:hypothetical protein CERZMDRAFT_31373, partial [Cercospora zeae-maydis SCOH1-5]